MQYLLIKNVYLQDQYTHIMTKRDKDEITAVLFVFALEIALIIAFGLLIR